MADETHSQIDALLKEDREFPPSPEFAAAAHVSDPAIYEQADKDPEGFWAKFAGDLEARTMALTSSRISVGVGIFMRGSEKISANRGTTKFNSTKIDPMPTSKPKGTCVTWRNG